VNYDAFLGMIIQRYTRTWLAYLSERLGYLSRVATEYGNCAVWCKGTVFQSEGIVE
jgi:hypothetical protein